MSSLIIMKTKRFCKFWGLSENTRLYLLIAGISGRKAHKCNECNKFASSKDRIGAHIILSQSIEEIPATLGLAEGQDKTRPRRGGQTIKKSDWGTKHSWSPCQISWDHRVELFRHSPFQHPRGDKGGKQPRLSRGVRNHESWRVFAQNLSKQFKFRLRKVVPTENQK